MKNEYDYSAYAETGHNSKAQLLEITKLAEKAYAVQQEVEQLEVLLKDKQTELKDLVEKRLPEAMDDAGLSKYSTTGGVHVKVSEKIRAALSAGDAAQAYKWLEKNGFGGIIKSEVVVPFKRNEIEEANKLVDKLMNENRLASLERKVEASTLTAFVKEQLTKGTDIPLDIFGAYRQRVAKVET